jgi:hypothetical protein
MLKRTIIIAFDRLQLKSIGAIERGIMTSVQRCLESMFSRFLTGQATITETIFLLRDLYTR